MQFLSQGSRCDKSPACLAVIVLWERPENQWWAGLVCCVLMAGWLTSSSVGPSPPSPTPDHPNWPRQSVPVREDMLYWRLNAESIRLRHPPLHLTFQGTRISSLCCQTFSTCYFALVPHVNSSSVPGGWAGRSGSTKVDAKMGMGVRLGPSDCHPLLASLLHVLSTMTQWVKVKRWMCENQFSDLLSLKTKNNKSFDVCGITRKKQYSK